MLNDKRIGFISAHYAEMKTLRTLMNEKALHNRFFFETCGQGPRNASQAAERLVEKKCDLLISWGVAGGLNPTHKCGDLIVSNRCVSEKGQEIFYRGNTAKDYIRRLETVVPATSGKVTTVFKAVTSAQRKKSLFQQTKADIVDMESHSIAKVAQANSIEFILVKAVIDEASDDVPNAFLECADEFGKPKLTKTFSVIWKQPGSISSLLKLGMKYRQSLKTLRLASQPFYSVKNGKKRI